MTANNDLVTSVSQQQSPTEEAIQTKLINYLSDLLLMETQEIDIQTTFENYNLDSSEMLSIVEDLEIFLGRQFSPELIYKYPTIKDLSAFLTQGK